MESKECDALGQWGYVGFLRVKRTLKRLKLLSNSCLTLGKILLFVMNHDEVVHIPNIEFDVQFFFDKVIHRIEDANSGNLNHLAARIISLFTLILTVQNHQGLLISPSFDNLMKAISYNLV